MRTAFIGTPSLRRRGDVRSQRGWALPSRFRQYLAQELGATGDRVSVTQLIVTGMVAAMVVAGFFGWVLNWGIAVLLPFTLGAGLWAALFLLRSAQHRFQRQFSDLFPEALDVIVRAVRAGLPVLDAIEAAVDNLGEPVAGEFRRLLDELRIGIDLEISLSHAGNRIRVNDFRFFGATLVLQRRTGGSLSETLTNLAGLIRKRKELHLKARALSAESRATAYVIGAMPFVLASLMYFINPDLISMLVTDPRGQIILSIAVTLLILGFVVMRSMIKRSVR
jgi:tight adherence protein B